jgi:hypothetical protein
VNRENERERSVERLLRESLATSPSTPGTRSCLDAETLAAWLDGGLAGGLRSEELLVLVLAVEIDEDLAQDPQGRQEKRFAVHQRPASAVGVEFAAHHDAILLGLDVEGANGIEEIGTGREIERPLDESPVDARAKPRDIGAVPEQEADRADHDRLPRPGLPGHHVEGGTELEFERFDEGETLYR